MPRSCGPGFGMRDRRRFLSGPAYARLLVRLLKQTRVRVEAGTTVLALTPGREGQPHQIQAASPGGLTRHLCKKVILATGCFRILPGVAAHPGRSSGRDHDHREPFSSWSSCGGFGPVAGP